ncbi:four helix bundle protein [Candidatus Uhrbacteria bacterium]|nr:four helix bundle protein [Candidatus Uhrbacteria bacterium]
MINNFDIPLFKKTYDLYKTFSSYRSVIPKQDRYTIAQRCESMMCDLLEGVMDASQTGKSEKGVVLARASRTLNMLRVFIRLMKDTHALDTKKYVLLETSVDEIGRMLGGWIRSTHG